MDLIELRDIVDRHALDEMKAQHRPIAWLELFDRRFERGLDLAGEPRALMIALGVARGSELGRGLVEMSLCAVLRTQPIERRTRRDHGDETRERAAPDGGEQIRRLAAQ